MQSRPWVPSDTLVIKLCSLILSPTCLASLACSLTYLLACLLDKLINSFIWLLWRVWNLYLNYFSKLYCFLVFVSIFSISTTFLYLYRSPESVPFSRIMIYDNDILCAYLLDALSPAYGQLKPACHYLTLDSCMLSPATWYMTAWPMIIIFMGILSWYPVLYTMTWIYSTYVLL